MSSANGEASPGDRLRCSLVKLRAVKRFRQVEAEMVGEESVMSLGLPPQPPTAVFEQLAQSPDFVDGKTYFALPADHAQQDLDDQQSDRYAMIERFFTLIERGRPDDLPLIQGMLDADPLPRTHDRGLLNVASKSSETALQVACRNNHAHVVRLLLASGCDPRRRGGGPGALEVAARWKSKETLRLLLDRGDWDDQALRRARKAAPSRELREQIAARLKSRGLFACFG